MARSEFAVREEYVGTGLLNEYTFDFKIEEASQLLVISLDEDDTIVQSVRGNDLSDFLSAVTFDATRGGGTVTLAENLTENHRLIFLLANDTPTQPSTFKTQHTFTLKYLEAAFDWLGGIIQRLTYRVNRAVRIHDFIDDDEFDTTLPANIKDMPGAVLAVNDTGDGFQLGATNDEVAAAQQYAADAEAAQAAAEAARDEALAAVEATFEGYSARFGEVWSSDGIIDTLNQILDITYTAPAVTLTASGSTTVREKGDAVTSSTLTAAITKRSDPIAEVRFYNQTDGDTLLDTQTSGGGIPSGGNSTYAWTGSFDDNTTFRVEVDDDGTTGGPTTVSATRSFTFVYPYYVGAGAASLSAANVASLTKRIITEDTSRTETITATAGQVFYFAYPASYGTLSSILDVNGFETLPDWTLRVENITGLDGNAVSYNIYEFNNPVIADDYEYTFNQ